MNETEPIKAVREGRERFENFEFGERTLPSSRHPNRNEDAYLVRPNEGFAVICDGMGGHMAGDLASKAAVSAIAEVREKWDAITDDDADLMEDSLKGLVHHAHEAVRALDNGQEYPPGTTVAIVQVHEFADGRKMAFVANVGDSRVYVYRAATGELEQVSVDDDILSTPLARQQWEEYYKYYPAQSDIERIRKLLNDAESVWEFRDGFEKHMFNFRNVITAALGSKMEPRVHFRSATVQSGDKIIAVCDGISDNLREKKMADEAAVEQSADQLAGAYVAAARAQADTGEGRAHHDDMTAVVIRVK